MKVLCIVQARLTSSRLPDKVIMPLAGKTIAEHVFERLSLSRHIDKVVFAIPTGERNDELEQFLEERGIPSFRGSEDNVQERFIGCIREYQPEIVVRATSDNPFVDWEQADRQIEGLKDCDYVSSEGAPLGTGVEVFYAAGLEEAYRLAESDREREHVTPYLAVYEPPCEASLIPVNYSAYALAQRIYEALYDGQPIANERIYAWLAEHPEVSHLNDDVEQKEGDLIAKR